MEYKETVPEKPSGLQVIAYIASSVKNGTELTRGEIDKIFGYLGYEPHEVNEYLSVSEGTGFLMNKGNVYVVLGASPIYKLPSEFEEVLEERVRDIISEFKLKGEN